MEISTALVVYLIVIVAIFILCKLANVKTMSALVLSLTIGFIVLSLLVPISVLKKLGGRHPNLVITYLIISSVTAVLSIWYIVVKALEDKNEVNDIDIFKLEF